MKTRIIEELDFLIDEDFLEVSVVTIDKKLRESGIKFFKNITYKNERELRQHSKIIHSVMEYLKSKDIENLNRVSFERISLDNGKELGCFYKLLEDTGSSDLYYLDVRLRGERNAK